MTTCDDDGLEREIPEIPGGGDASGDVDRSEAILVTEATAEHRLTPRDDRDVHSAITYGLAAYLLQLERSHAGRVLRIEWATADWADPEDANRPLPSAAVHSEEEGVYESAGMTPSKPEILDPSQPSEVLSIVCTGTYRLSSLLVEVRCTDKVQREGMRRMLEDAMSPVTWMGGFRLVLPAYHNAIAQFMLTSAQFVDDAVTAMSGLRLLRLRLTAWCDVYRLHRLPLARPATRGTLATRGG